jgi:hypothetical protein
MECPACGAPNEKDAVFCGSCGTSLSAEAQFPPVGTEAVQDTLAKVTSEVEEGQEAAAGALAGVGAAMGGGPQEAPEEGLEAPEVEAVSVEAARPEPRSSAYAAPSNVPTSGMAIASLVSGIGGLTFVPLIGSIAALIFGYIARGDIRRRAGEVSGDGVAVTGLVLGWIGIGLTILLACLVGAIAVCAVVGASSAGWSGNW